MNVTAVARLFANNDLTGSRYRSASGVFRKSGEVSLWLPPRDSNPDMLIQSQLSYH